MFERYTEHARRAIFFARYEASEAGAMCIEPEHLLLGVLRERASLNLPLSTDLNLEQARRHFQSMWPVRDKISTSVEIPLTDVAQRVLAYAAEEAERLSHAHIGTQHLLLGLLHEPTSASTMLHKYGLELEELRNKIAQVDAEPMARAKNREIMSALRERFAQRLSPELEPATIYLLPLPKTGPEPAE
jgi:ATP-dependent Clp protease ATP-binding subunit ClpC